jgi:two-component system, OmpR family, KDP operon response regulator KdpE
MSAPPIRVLVVDDEPQILRALRAALKGHGYDVQTAADGEEALDALALHPPDIVILDLVMPGKSGFDVVREVRGWSQSAQRTPAIIVLSARGEDRDKVTALDLGADDYLTKPFSMNELLARIRVALRHRPEQAAVGPVIDAGPVTIDLARRVVTRDGAEVHLTPTEWQLLAELAREAGKVLTQRMLLQRVWGPEYADEAQYLRVYINQLRRKLDADPPRPRILITEPGVGYRFIADED